MKRLAGRKAPGGMLPGLFVCWGKPSGNRLRSKVIRIVISMKKMLTVAIICLTTAYCPAQSWVRENALPATDVFLLEYHNGTLYAGTIDHVYISADNGAQWKATQLPGSPYVQAITEFHGRVYVGTARGGVLTSSDHGITWATLPGSGDVSCFVTWKDHLYMGTLGDGFYLLDEAASQLRSFNNGFATIVDGIVWKMSTTDSALIAAAGSNGFFYSYNEPANSWESSEYLSRPAPGLQIVQLLYDSATVALYAISLQNAFLLRSNDRGRHWAPDSTGFGLRTSQIIVNNMMIAGDGRKKYIASSFISIPTQTNQTKVYERNSNATAGMPWIPTDTIFNSFFYAIATAGNRLYSARNNGLFYKELSTPIVPPPGKDFIVYPNPSRGSITVTFSQPPISALSIHIFDATGRLTAAPYENLVPANGIYSFPINVGNLANGIYFIQVHCGQIQQTRRLVIKH